MSHHEFEGILGYFAGLSPLASGLFVTPFVLMLLAIAILPLLRPHFWEKNQNKSRVAFLLSFPIFIFFAFQNSATLIQTVFDYLAFIALLGSLYVISGGIYIQGTFAPKPLVNTTFLLIGAVLANLIGTTGASMVLIRPLLRANHTRHHKTHLVIFFIFIVSNCGGLLTPLGDPPLFLGFLKGVDFFWTFRLWREWLTVNGLLLVIFYVFDVYFVRREPHAHPAEKSAEILSERFAVQGRSNLFLLLGVIGVILASGYLVYPLEGAPLFGEPFGAGLSKMTQFLILPVLAFLSYHLTPKVIHEKNHFGFGPIQEVAILFAGIFITMIPALLILETQGARLGITAPWQFYWASGSLSSFLDNAPTYLTFTSLAKGVLGLTDSGLVGLVHDPVGASYLIAISCGAVFMGANTYIGNGPNFMVKAIAEHQHVKMPHFFGYMAWSATILLPIFLLIHILFLR